MLLRRRIRLPLSLSSGYTINSFFSSTAFSLVILLNRQYHRPSISMPQTAIFWDYENCRPPINLSGSKLTGNIRRLVQGTEIITNFKAYLDISLECENPRSVVLHSELQSSGVTLVHCPHNGKKDVVDKMMIVDMLAFALVKPSPTTIVMITGDRDYSYAAATLKQRGHKVVVIVPPNTGQSILRMQADYSYDWWKDVIGETSAEVDAVEIVELVPEPRQAPPKKQYEHEEFDAQSPEPCSQVQHWRPTPSSHASELETISRAENSENGCDPTRTTAEPPVVSRLDINTKSTSRVELENENRADQPTSLGQLIGGLDRSRIHLKSLGIPQDGVKGTRCTCSICLRSSNVFPDQKPDLAKGTDKQWTPPHEATSEQTSPAEARLAEQASMSTDTPSSISSGNLSSDSMPSSVPSNIFSGWSYVVELSRFGTLLEVFCEYYALTGATSIRSSTLAAEMLKRDLNVYKNAGVTRMKQYLEEAGKAKIITAPEPDHGGSSLIELNPKVVGNVFMPLVDRLRSEKPSYRLSHSTLGIFFKTEHPGIYERAEVSGLSEYIKKAEERGIVQSRAGESTRWVDLMPAYY